MKKIKTLSLSALLILPVIAGAQLTNTGEFITAVGNLVERLLIIVAGLGLLVFMWGLVKFIYKAGDKAAVDEGKNLMKWGIIALFVMVSVWGIIHLIRAEIFPTTPFDSNITLPRVPR